MNRIVELKAPHAVAKACDQIQRELHVNILALVLMDLDGKISTIPNPNFNPADVFRTLSVQNWDASARVAEEFSR